MDERISNFLQAVSLRRYTLLDENFKYNTIESGEEIKFSAEIKIETI